MRKIAALPGLILLALSGLLYFHDRYAAYRSPLYGAEIDWTPRLRGLSDLQRWREQKTEEERRRAELLRNLTTEKMVELGGEIVLGKGKCLNCHKVSGAGGDRGPDLTDVGARAAARVPGMTDLEYLARSLYEPDAFVVPGYSPGMVPANKPPIGLDELEIAMVIAYLQSLGGTPMVTPQTKLPYGGK